MSKTIAITLSLLSIIVACDATNEECLSDDLQMAAPADAVPPSELNFREQGPPQNLVITKYKNATINRAAFADLVLSPGALSDPPLTCTLSWYQPNLTKDTRVVGLGCSMMAPEKLWDSYRQTFVDNGGVPVP